MKKLLLLLVVAILVAGLGVMSWRALQLRPQPGATPDAPPPDSGLVSVAITADRLAQSLRFPTVSTQDSATWDPAPFAAFREWLAGAYPRVHAGLTREVVNEHALLFTWRGTDTTLAPALLTGHYDVVPVEPGTDSMWTHPAFSGTVADGWVWGRGALDDKVTVIGIMEAVDVLLSRGFVPRRTVLLAFGHDEEVEGWRGAAHLAKAIQARHPRVAFLVDEGGVVSDGVIPGLSRKAALIGVAEKAPMSVELSVTAAGGHSSMPPARTALGTLSKALVALEEHQMPARFTPVSRAMFGSLAPEMGFGARFAFANIGMLEPLILRGLLSDPKSATTVRTSTAVTMASGSPKENVLPIRATAVVNFRMLQGDSAESVLAHVRRAIGDTSVQLKVLRRPRKPSATANMTSPEFATLTRTIAQWYPGALVVPNLLAGATDTRHYEALTDNIFRFVPVLVNGSMINGAHGTDERVPAADFVHGVRFWAQLIINAQ